MAQWAEQRGLAGFALPDHYLHSTRGDRVSEPVYDPFPQLAGLSRETAAIRLAVLVSPVTFRHPAVLLKNAVTLDAMSGGRFSLGVGTGWLEEEHTHFGLPFPDRSERFARMEEALGYLRAGFSLGGPGFDGRFYQLAPGPVSPQPTSGLQVVVGGMGARRTPTLAGRYADEYNVYPAPLEEMTDRISIAKAAAVEAGRDPQELVITSSGAIVVGRTAADYRERLAAIASDFNTTVAEIETHFQARGTPRGSAEEVRAIISGMESIGVTRFYVQSLFTPALSDIEETFELIGAFR